MNERRNTADALLVTLDAESGREPAVLLGKSLVQRQLDLGIELGCSRLILLGDDMAPHAIALRHIAEKSGLIVQVASGPHALTALLAPRDSLLVLQPDLLVEAASVFEGLPVEGGIMTLPAGAGGAAGAGSGFERIDLARDWAGALVIRGEVLSQLLDLPEDSETVPALLRIGLQAGLTEKRLDGECLTDGSWTLVGTEDNGALVEEKWLARHAASVRSLPPSKWIAARLTRKFAGLFLSKKSALPVSLGAAFLLAAGTGIAGWFGLAVPAFAMIALAAIVLETCLFMASLRAAPFGSPGPLRHLRLYIDLMLVVCCIFLVDGIWFRQVFGPLVLLAALHLPQPGYEEKWPMFVRDRALIGLLMAGLAAVMPVEPMVMAVSLLILSVILGVNWLTAFKERG